MAGPFRKKIHTLLFMAAATLFCALLTALFFAALFLLSCRVLEPGAETWLPRLLPALFVAAALAAFLIYRALLDRVFMRLEIDEYFDPIGLRPPFLKPRRNKTAAAD